MPSVLRSIVTSLLVILPGLVPVAAEGDWTAKRVMKEVDRATKQTRWIEGRVHWNQFLGSAVNVDGQGSVWVDLNGRFRAEVAGNNPRTVLISPGYVQLYKPREQVTEVYTTIDQPDLLVQYATLGFQPRGSDLKRDYKVSFVRHEQIEGRETFLLELEPKDAEVANAYPALMLWIDRATWLPARQLIRQGDGGLQVTLRYEALETRTDLPGELFQSKWPKGTKIVRE